MVFVLNKWHLNIQLINKKKKAHVDLDTYMYYCYYHISLGDSSWIWDQNNEIIPCRSYTCTSKQYIYTNTFITKLADRDTIGWTHTTKIHRCPLITKFSIYTYMYIIKLCQKSLNYYQKLKLQQPIRLTDRQRDGQIQIN